MPDHVRSWVRRETGAAVARVLRLPGASSTAVHALVLSDGRRVVLRRYSWPGFLSAEPTAPQREVDALQFACAAKLPGPDVLAADVDGSAVGDGVPVVLMTRLAGKAVAVPDLGRLAEVAATIHSIDAAGFAHAYFPWYADTTTSPPAEATRPELWESALDVWHTQMPVFEPCFVHRDFHPGNVLWVRGRCTGVVDWANACRGPWGCDVAHCRENLIRLGGLSAADGFLAAYEALTGAAYHPYWEVASVLEHGPSWWTVAQVAGAEPRLAAALSLLGQLP